MSKSLKRVKTALSDAGLADTIRETTLARTAAEAAAAIGCVPDQIAKSILLAGRDSGPAYLFITAGGAQVDPQRAGALAGETLERAQAALIRAQTGFAIGGVAPVGHLTPPRAWFDKRLMEFDLIWAAAGTPHHVFAAKPADILRLSGAQLADFTTLSK